MKWKIYYADGTTFSNEDGNPEDAPGWGVIAIAQEDKIVGVFIHHQKDFYCFDKEFGGWMGMDYFGFTQYLAKPGLKIVKLGDNMPTHKYRELIKSLRKDNNMPHKSAKYEWERSTK